ncbi:MAG: winged helix-turn-helix domain-containing protein [Pirellulales bacterium]|nr:winged helix-turn-helix domain-containing protein [Pirellulales bacterium]
MIGQAAGEVWRVLSERGGQTLAGLKKSLDASDDLVLLGIGWLAREDKLAFETNGRTVTVSLK